MFNGLETGRCSSRSLPGPQREVLLEGLVDLLVQAAQPVSGEHDALGLTSRSARSSFRPAATRGQSSRICTTWSATASPRLVQGLARSIGVVRVVEHLVLLRWFRGDPLHHGGVFLHLNPGSAGPRRFRLPVTVARLRVTESGLDHEIIELAV